MFEGEFGIAWSAFEQNRIRSPARRPLGVVAGAQPPWTQPALACSVDVDNEERPATVVAKVRAVVRVNVSCRPSGDQPGSVSVCAVSGRVSRRSSWPEGVTIQTDSSPARAVMPIASLEPFGDHAAKSSPTHPTVQAATSLGRPPLALTMNTSVWPAGCAETRSAFHLATRPAPRQGRPWRER